MPRQLGCRLAISHCGLQFGAQVCAGLVDPDIIKINPRLLWRGAIRAREASRLADTMALAQDTAASVIVDGVESAAQLAVVADSGAVWAQSPWLTATALPFDGATARQRPAQYA